MPDEETCFVISPIGEPDSETRERADRLFEYVIKPPVEEYGYEPVRADHIAEPGIITSQVIEHVVDSPIVLADLSGSNANVFYELAVRHSIQKPIIQLIDRSQNIPFDVAGTRTIQIDLTDIESAELAKSEIREQIENIEGNNPTVDTPISVALDLQHMRQSADPDERSMADIMELLSELRSTMVSIQNDIEAPEKLIPPDYLERISRRYDLQETEELTYLLDETAELIDQLKESIPPDDSDDEEYLENLIHRIDQTHMRLRNEITHRQTSWVVSNRGLDDFR